MNLNDLLSDTLKVKPLRPGEVAKFELLNRYKKEPGRDEPSCPDSWDLCEQEDIFDPGANGGLGGKIRIKNWFSDEPYTTKEGKREMREVLKKITFTKGVATITHEDPNAYIFMLRSKKNIDNPFRGNKTRAVFRLMNERRDSVDELQKLDLQWEAVKLIRESKGWDEVRAIQKKLNSSPDTRFHVNTPEGDLQALKLGMVKLAQAYPKQVINASENIEAKNRVYISDGVQFNILLWTQEKMTWSLYDTKKGMNNLELLTTVDPTEDKYDALLKHFTTELGRKHYTVFVNILKNVYKGVNN